MVCVKRIILMLLVLVMLIAAVPISAVASEVGVMSTSLSTAMTVEHAYAVKITGSTVNVRVGAGTEYSKIGTVSKNSTYTYLDSQAAGDGVIWYKIQYTETTEGWVISQYSTLLTTTAETFVATTETSATDVETTTESNIAASGSDATTTTTTTTTTTVESTTTTTTTTTTAATVKKYVVMVTGGSTLNVRKGAGTSYKKLGTAATGTVYDYLGCKKVGSTTWYKIQYTSSKIGWVSSKNCTKIELTENFDKTIAQAYVNAMAKKYGATGIQVAVIDNGVVTDVFNYGYATKKTAKMTSDNKIRVASISKVAVAVCAMKMQEEGIVSVDENIGTYWNTRLPKKVTLKNLLTHTSTLKNLGYASTKAATLSQLKKSGNYRKGTAGASSMWTYNNYAIGVAGATLEVAAGTTLDKYAKKNIFEPLGMDAAFCSGNVNNTSKLATLYYNSGKVSRSVSAAKKYKGSSNPGANAKVYAGGLTTSAQDLAKFVAMLANDGTYNEVQILTPESVEIIEKKMFKKSQYGGSFYQCMPLRYKANLYGESELYYHTGNALGVLSLMSYNPATGDGVVVITTGAKATRDSQGVYAVCSTISKYMYKNIV